MAHVRSQNVAGMHNPGRLHAPPYPLPSDNSDDEDDEDGVSKEQEELRRQYLSSMAGHGDDDDDDDEDGYRKPRMKIKFKISDTAIVKPQAPIGTISLGMALPGPSTSKRKPGRFPLEDHRTEASWHDWHAP